MTKEALGTNNVLTWRKKTSAVPETGGRHTRGHVIDLGPQSNRLQVLSGSSESMAILRSGTLERNDWYSALCPNGTLDRGSMGRGTLKGSMCARWDYGWNGAGEKVDRLVETS